MFERMHTREYERMHARTHALSLRYVCIVRVSMTRLYVTTECYICMARLYTWSTCYVRKASP